MYLDIVSGEANAIVSKKAMSVFGIQCAVYWSELTKILWQVKKKHTLTDDGYFKLNRLYMEEQTTLSKADQLFCEARFEKAGVIKHRDDSEDEIQVDLQKMADILITDDEQTLSELKRRFMSDKELKAEARREAKIRAKEEKEAKARVKAAKQAEVPARKPKDISGEIIGKKHMCSSIVGIPALVDTYDEFVDAMYQGGKGWKITKVAIEAMFKRISSFSSDLNVHKAIMKIASINGWIDADWSINSYSRSCGKPTVGTVLTAPQNIATDVSDLGSSF